MPTIVVHGVPDTHHLWDGVRHNLSRTDVYALALPGFATPLPQGFKASKEEYVDWIIARLEEFKQPVDLVGHDWGCIFTARIASLRPDLVRTWAGGGGPVSASYEWHSFAKIWQAEGLGEKWMAEVDSGQFAQDYERFGVPADIARAAAARIDDKMKDCILRLYRSAVNLGKEWEPGLANVKAPSLVFWGIGDVTTPIAFADRLAKSMRARNVLRLDSQHFTPYQRPIELAQGLEKHWRE